MTALDQHLDVDRYVGRYVDQNHGWFYSNANSNVDEFQILFRLSCDLINDLVEEDADDVGGSYDGGGGVAA